MGESKTAAERDVLRLLEGFLSTKVLITAYRLDVFTKLAREPAPLDAAPRALGLPARSGSILVNACLGLGLLELREGLVQTPARYHSLLVRAPDQPFNTTRYLLDYYHEVYRALSDMDELVRRDGEGSSFRLRDYFKADVSEVEAKVAAEYSRYMEETIAPIAQVALETYDFSQHRYVVDLCGCTGSLCEALVEATPGLRGGFIDVPACVALGRDRLAARPELAARVDPIAGDVFSSPLPKGVDLYVLCRAAMDWDDDQLRQLLARAYESLEPGGRVLIIERMLPREPTPEALGLYLRAVYFLAKSRTTRYRSPAEYHALLEGAGFREREVLSPPRAPYEFFQSMKLIVGRKAVG